MRIKLGRLVLNFTVRIAPKQPKYTSIWDDHPQQLDREYSKEELLELLDKASNRND